MSAVKRHRLKNTAAKLVEPETIYASLDVQRDRRTPSSSSFLDYVLPRNPRRSQNAVIVAILDACRTPMNQYDVMVKAHIAEGTRRRHMNRLILMGVLDVTDKGDKTLYGTNSDGLALLKRLTGA